MQQPGLGLAMSQSHLKGLLNQRRVLFGRHQPANTPQRKQAERHRKPTSTRKPWQ
jgi:hypothetical protein